MADKRRKRLRCAIYTRKSTDEGLDQEFNSLDAQREACAAFVASQKHEGWICLSNHYDDGGISGSTLDRPAMQRLLTDIKAHKIDVVVVYKVDRLTRALADFAKIVEIFDAHTVSFVSVTQQFNTTTSMGRLTLNVLLSFAQFEREVTAERIRDKIAASKKKGMWMGGAVPLGYDAKDRKLVINHMEADTVRTLYQLYLEKGNVREVTEEANRRGLRTKRRDDLHPRMRGGRPFSRGHIYRILSNPIYIGRIAHKKESYSGLHPPIIGLALWEKTQALLKSNRVQRRNGTNASDPSPLAGKLFDDLGNAFTPSHATKRGRRYRYYIERRPEITDNNSVSARPKRIAANEIEKLLLDALNRFLKTPARLIDALGEIILSAAKTKSIASAGKRLAAKLDHQNPKDTYATLRSLISRVIISDKDVGVSLNNSGLSGLLDLPGIETDQLDEPITLTIPARLKPRGVELKFVMIDPGHRQSAKPDPILIKAIVQANDWLEQLMSGKAATLRELADRDELPERYLRRLLELAFLAPDITESILNGHQPEDLTLKHLTCHIKLPLAWDRQRMLLGFA
ncbi:MAG: recombinase family protein [Alphaproteobacteria bacterium]|nr:recombinase family protein [Alphaproteobacteria bacterium]